MAQNNDGLPLLFSAWMSVPRAIGLANAFLVASCIVLYWAAWRRNRSACGLQAAMFFCLSFFLFQISNNVCWIHYRVHLLAFVPTVLACCGERTWLRRLSFAAFFANFFFVPRPYLEMLGLSRDQVPVLLSDFGIVCHFFLLAVMVLVLVRMIEPKRTGQSESVPCR